MSTSLSEPTRPTVPTAAEVEARRRFYATALGRYVLRRRIELQMTVEQAAKLAGMAFSEWVALEAGWLPERDELWAIAAVLEVSATDLSFLAAIARCYREAAEAELLS